MGEAIGVGRLPARRYWSNKLIGWVVSLGGAAVIGAITLIFAYLLWVVAPIFAPGSISDAEEFPVVDRTPLLVDVSENGEVMLRVSAEGIVEFYAADSGQPISAYNLGTAIKQIQRVYPLVDLYAFLDTDNNLRFLRTRYIVTFVDGERALTPKIDFPFGATIALLGDKAFEAHLVDGELMVAASDGKQLELQAFKNAEPGLKLGTPQRVVVPTSISADHILLGPRNGWVYLIANNGAIEILGIKPFSRIQRLYTGQLVTGTAQLNAVAGILGRYSIVSADSNGQITQWTLLRANDGTQLNPVRSFQLDDPAVTIIAEPRRKGFATLSGNGVLSLLYPTSGRMIADKQTAVPATAPMAISPRSNRLVAAPDRDSLRLLELHNEHPEISFSTLWQKVWYEGYEEPIYSWQSSSANNDFEPKFSLMPLAFGTLKAAFYALLFAVPIAIMGAIYTAYFMAPTMRSWVKPGIEIMAALPTVILGFIGGLWLAPIIEANLSSVLGIFVVLPIGLFLFALLWSQFPERITKPFAGWYGLIVSPLIVITVYLAFDIGPFLEDTMFGGDSKTWFREVMGLEYDQRNALVVGIVMGLAVIPTIFSIAEDAIYGVPTHLINGSLALGATPWQTLVRVVLLTASPGIFSAVMIGMGRAVGETMIVLMATGNTPLMDFNIFEGMRTFAANIAVELPESEVDSTHYRILFLAALVLFVLTFIFNTAAEIVRQRLRTRYGSL
jgi:phosphate transport system permease protein